MRGLNCQSSQTRVWTRLRSQGCRDLCTFTRWVSTRASQRCARAFQSAGACCRTSGSYSFAYGATSWKLSSTATSRPWRKNTTRSPRSERSTSPHSRRRRTVFTCSSESGLTLSFANARRDANSRHSRRRWKWRAPRRSRPSRLLASSESESSRSRRSRESSSSSRGDSSAPSVERRSSRRSETMRAMRTRLRRIT